ncbi:MAG: methyltransferase [Actinomycetota bacterium]|nr:methyltransferase [Actinomycetota bacterium]
MKLLTLPGVHRPLNDTWMLADVMLQHDLDRARVVDLCTGAGVLAIAAARRGANVTAVDLTMRAVLSARINAFLAGATVRVVRGDLFAPIQQESFDMIVSNPPYIPAETDELPRRGPRVSLDAGLDGRALIDRICGEAPHHLLPGGVVLLVHSSICGTQQTCDALSAGGLESEVVLRRPGPLGPVMSARAEMMRERGLLGPEDREEIVVVRGRRPSGRADEGETAAWSSTQ